MNADDFKPFLFPANPFLAKDRPIRNRLLLQSSRGSIVSYDSRPEQSQGHRRRHTRCQANREQSILYPINR